MNLLRRIELHLRQSGTAPSRFGRDALGDPRLVQGLRNGRELRPLTRNRIVDYLERVEGETKA